MGLVPNFDHYIFISFFERSFAVCSEFNAWKLFGGEVAQNVKKEFYRTYDLFIFSAVQSSLLCHGSLVVASMFVGFLSWLSCRRNTVMVVLWCLAVLSRPVTAVL